MKPTANLLKPEPHLLVDAGNLAASAIVDLAHSEGKITGESAYNLTIYEAEVRADADKGQLTYELKLTLYLPPDEAAIVGYEHLHYNAVVNVTAFHDFISTPLDELKGY